MRPSASVGTFLEWMGDHPVEVAVLRPGERIPEPWEFDLSVQSGRSAEIDIPVDAKRRRFVLTIISS